MAYRCRECGSGFTRGCAFRTHQHVHARVQGQQGRVRFAGTEPYDPSEYPARVLARDDDDADGGGAGASDVEDPTQRVRVALSVEEEIKLRLCELKTNGAAGSGLSEADMTNILRIVALAGVTSSRGTCLSSWRAIRSFRGTWQTCMLRPSRMRRQ